MEFPPPPPPEAAKNPKNQRNLWFQAIPADLETIPQ